MQVRAIKTHKITIEDSLYDVFDRYVDTLDDKTVVAVSSKIVSITDKRVVKPTDRENLIRSEADRVYTKHKPYGKTLTIKDNILIPDAGIDESNADGFDVLWPEDSQKSANQIRKYLMQKHNIKNLGVVITDSKTTPLRWGTTGFGIAHSGFLALHDYIGTEDIFGREMIATKSNIMDGLAASAVLAMGEGAEQTPIAILSDLDFVSFQDRVPSESEISDISIPLDEDIYGPIFKDIDWEKGKLNK